MCSEKHTLQYVMIRPFFFRQSSSASYVFQGKGPWCLFQVSCLATAGARSKKTAWPHDFSVSDAIKPTELKLIVSVGDANKIKLVSAQELF